jgi:class 3 adenylate cyclase/tetratricopeptide (TPR) repeat protein
MRCPYCQTINPEEAKFCLNCGRRLVIVCLNCGTVNPPNARFCIECGLQLQPPGDQAAPQGTLTRNLSRQTQPLPDSLLSPEERRIVTIMFADIMGSTPLADRLDPEDMRAMLAGYFNLMAKQIRKHGGTVEKYIGDAVMAVFGLPQAHEDDPDRAIRAALDMQNALAAFNQERQEEDMRAARLQMRIGINTGEVAAPSSRQLPRQDFLITGDAVNVAARLQAVATPDTILVGERTYLATRGVFDFRALAPLRIKGKPEPLPAWVVLGAHERGSAITQRLRGLDGLQADFVGRTLELALMHATYARVLAEQRPHLITLLGTPGIGKSRLIREFIQREREAAKSAANDERITPPIVLQGRCPPYGQGVTFRPLLEITYSLLKTQGNESNDVIEASFTALVQQTLALAKSSEDPLQIAQTIIRSLGLAPSEHTGELSSVDGREYHYLSPREAVSPREAARTATSALGKSGEQSSASTAFMRAWRVFLESLALQQPIIIVIDDLQWADEALLDLLEYLTERITDVPILFLCPARPDFIERKRDWGGGRRNFTTMALEALSREESSDLITELLQTEEIPDVLRHTILQRAEGNPFFVEEIVRMLIDQKVLVSENGYWRVSEQSEALINELASPAAPPDDTLLDLHYILPLPRLPDTIQGVLAARVDLLSQVEKLVLQHAAIIGRTFWLPALLELASGLPEDTILKTLDSLIEHEFIVETGGSESGPLAHERVFSFKHVLIRDVVYNTIPRARRSGEHARLALWLEQQSADNPEAFAEVLAYHYQQALVTWSASTLQAAGAGNAHSGDLLRLTRPELRRRAILYLTIAGDQAFRSYFTIRAIQAYSEALDLLVDSEADAKTLAQMRQKLGDAFFQRGNADDAWRAYQQALKSLTEAPEAADSDTLLCLYNRLAELGTRWLGLFNTNPDSQEARAYIDAGLKLLEERPDSGQRAEFLTYQAFWYLRSQTESSAIDERAEFARLALQSASDALHIAESLSDTYALWVTLDALSSVYHKQHLYEEAHQTQHRRLELVDQIKSREELKDLYYSLGWTHEAVGDFPTAIKWFGYAWQIAQTMESPTILLDCLIGRLYVWHRWNRWEEAQEVAHTILQLIDRYQLNEQWRFDALEALAVTAYRTGHEEDGEDYARQYKRLLDKYTTQQGLLPVGLLPVMPTIYTAREDWARAIADYEEYIQRSEPFPSPKSLASLAELLVMTGAEPERQQELCERAVTTAVQSGGRRSQVIALRARGRLRVEQQRWPEAEQDLKRSLSLSEAIDLPWEEGKTLYDLASLYRRRADSLFHDDTAQRTADLERARHHFELALGFFESMHAVRNIERTRQALAQFSQAPV